MANFKKIIRGLLSSRLLQKTLKLSSLSMVANFLGFLIPVYIAYIYGISKITDDFFFSYGIIVFISTIFSGAVKSVIVPFLLEKVHDKILFDRFISTVLYYSFSVLGTFSIVLLIVFSSINHFVSTNLYFYLAISTPIFFFTVLNSLCYGVLNSLNQFYQAEISPFSRAIIIYGTIFLTSRWFGISAVILGYNLGEIGKFVHLVYILKQKNNINLSFRNKNYGEIKPFVREGVLQSLATSIASASPIIDKIVASFLVVGSLSILDYGNRLFMVFSVILSAFLTIILSKWSTEVVSKKFNIKEMNRIIIAILGVTFFLFCITWITKAQITEILYPKIGIDQRRIIANVIVLNMLAFVFNAGNQIINRATIAFKGTNVLINVSIVKFIINIVFDILFMIFYGVIGIAISTILVNLAGFLLNYSLFITLIKPNLAKVAAT